MASRPHGPVTSTSSQARTCDAVATIVSSRWRAATAHWNSTRRHHSLDGEAIDHDALRSVIQTIQREHRDGSRSREERGEERVRLRRHHELVVAEAERALLRITLEPHE